VVLRGVPWRLLPYINCDFEDKTTAVEKFEKLKPTGRSE
jgi:hypothetical protein